MTIKLIRIKDPEKQKQLYFAYGESMCNGGKEVKCGSATLKALKDWEHAIEQNMIRVPITLDGKKYNLLFDGTLASRSLPVWGLEEILP